jgi:DNA-binding beta-propeller fold protein YncE
VLISIALGLAAAGPATPGVTGPTRTQPGTRTYVFSSAEKGVPSAKLRFRCALDSAALHACPRTLTLALTAGKHVLRVQAVDPAGRRSPVRGLTIVVYAAAPRLSVQTVWSVNVAESTTGDDLQSVAIGPDGTVYAADAADDRVAVYSRDGQLLRRFGSTGRGPGQFDFSDNPDPEDAGVGFGSIAVDQQSGAVYVADSHRVQRFDPGGAFQLGWGTAGTGTGQFTRVIDLEVGPSGRVYVLEDRPYHLGRVQVFDASGAFRIMFGLRLFVDTGGIAVDSAGNALVTDDKADSIKVLDPTGRVLKTFGEAGALSFPTALALHGNALYVVDQNHSRIVRFDVASGAATGFFPTVAGQPTAVAVDAAGSIYVASNEGTLTKYLPS